MAGKLGDKGAVQCFGCDAALPDEIGVYYCAQCVAGQLEEHAAECQAFQDFHRFADYVARAVGCPSCGRLRPILPHDSAHCGACFLTFRASDPRSSLPKRGEEVTPA